MLPNANNNKLVLILTRHTLARAGLANRLLDRLEVVTDNGELFCCVAHTPLLHASAAGAAVAFRRRQARSAGQRRHARRQHRGSRGGLTPSPDLRPGQSSAAARPKTIKVLVRSMTMID